MKTEEKTLKENTIYSGRILNLRVDTALLPNGEQATREFVVHNGGVTVAAMNSDDELVFVRQFRYPYMAEVLELPAGKLELGEDPFEAGKRELREEAGVTADEYLDLGTFYPSPGYTSEIIYLYAATGLHSTEQDLDEDEFLNVEWIKLDKAVEMIMSGEITDGKTIAAVLKLKEKLKR